MLSEAASSKVIRGSLLECEEVVENSHIILLIEFEWKVEIRRCKWKSFKQDKYVEQARHDWLK